MEGILAISLGLKKQDTFWLSHRGRSVSFASAEEGDAVLATLKDVEAISKDGDRLFIGPGDLRRLNYCDLDLYFLLPQLFPASYFMEMNQGSTNRDGPAPARNRLRQGVDSELFLGSVRRPKRFPIPGAGGTGQICWRSSKYTRGTVYLWFWCDRTLCPICPEIP